MGVRARRVRYRISLRSKVSLVPKTKARTLSTSPNTREEVKVTKPAVMET